MPAASRPAPISQSACAAVWPEARRHWDFGGLRLDVTSRGGQGVYEAVRDYTVVRPWLWAQEKRALDGANAELLAYDRLSLYMPARPAALWLPGFLLRIAIWGGLPALGVLVWLIRRLWPG